MSSVKITQIRSTIGQSDRHLGTLRALGLGKIGKSAEQVDSPQLRGMLRQVAHLVRVDAIARLEAYAKGGFKEPSEAYGPFAYVAANLIIDAIEEVGPDRAKVAAKLKRTKNANTIIGPVEFDEHGQNTVPLISKYVSQDGKWVLWEDSEYASGKRTLPGIRFKKQ